MVGAQIYTRTDSFFQDECLFVPLYVSYSACWACWNMVLAEPFVLVGAVLLEELRGGYLCLASDELDLSSCFVNDRDTALSNVAFIRRDTSSIAETITE